MIWFRLGRQYRLLILYFNLTELRRWNSISAFKFFYSPKWLKQNHVLIKGAIYLVPFEKAKFTLKMSILIHQTRWESKIDNVCNIKVFLAIKNVFSYLDIKGSFNRSLQDKSIFVIKFNKSLPEVEDCFTFTEMKNYFLWNFEKV